MLLLFYKKSTVFLLPLVQYKILGASRALFIETDYQTNIHFERRRGVIKAYLGIVLDALKY